MVVIMRLAFKRPGVEIYYGCRLDRGLIFPRSDSDGLIDHSDRRLTLVETLR